MDIPPAQSESLYTTHNAGRAQMLRRHALPVAFGSGVGEPVAPRVDRRRPLGVASGVGILALEGCDFCILKPLYILDDGSRLAGEGAV